MIFNYRVTTLSTQKDKNRTRMDGCSGFGTTRTLEAGIYLCAQWLIKVINVHYCLLQNLFALRSRSVVY